MAAGVSQGSSGATQVGHRPDEGLRGWIEDRLLVELAARMLPPHLQPVSPEAHVMALREAVLHLDQGVSHPDALRVLKESVADHDALRQGRCALQGV